MPFKKESPKCMFYETINGTYIPVEIQEITFADSLNAEPNITITAKQSGTSIKAPEKIPEPKCIVQNNKATIVHWTDGTYTAVVCGDDDSPNVYAAYCAAFQKKLLGSTSAVHKLVDRNLADNIKKKRDEEIRKHQAEQAEREQANHERKVREIAKQIKMEREAYRMLDSEF